MANQWLTGSGVPSTGIGQVTDYYRDTVSNLVYYRENAFTWVVVPAFTPSPDGIGTTWLHGNVPPLTGQGSDGDYYYDEVQLIVYRKDVATWVPKGSLDFIGLYGVQWGNGLGAPASTVPLNALPAGSFYLDVVTSDIYYKGPSMSWELKGQLGGGGGGGGSSINLITTLEEVAELDVTSAVTPSVIYDLDLLKADLASPAFTGTPTAPTPQTEPSLDNSTKLATTEFVNVVADAAVATANAYADGLVVNLWDDRGTFNPSSGAWPTSANGGSGVSGAIQAGDVWTSSGAGTLTGGITVEVGDVIRALVDLAGNTSTDWAVTQNNLGYTAENSTNKATDLSLPDDTKYPTTQAVVTALGGYEPELPANVGSVKFLREDRTWQTAPAPVLTETNFAVEKNGQPTYTVKWVLTALTAAQLWTVPDKAINFGDLSSIATTNSNTLGGTGCRIEGGNNNNVSGTNSSTYMCQYQTVTGTDNRAIFSRPKTGTGIFTHAGDGNTYYNHRHNGNTSGSSAVNCTFYDCYGIVGASEDVNVVYRSAGLGSGVTLYGFIPHTQVTGNGVSDSPLRAVCMLQSPPTLTGVPAVLVSLVSGAVKNKPPLFRNGGNGAYHDIVLNAYDTNLYGNPVYMLCLRRQVTVYELSGTPVISITTLGTDLNPSNLTFTVSVSVVNTYRMQITVTATDPVSPAPPIPLTYVWSAVVESTYF